MLLLPVLLGFADPGREVRPAGRAATLITDAHTGAFFARETSEGQGDVGLLTQATSPKSHPINVTFFSFKNLPDAEILKQTSDGLGVGFH